MNWKYRKDFEILPGIKLTYGRNGIKTNVHFPVDDTTVDAEKLKLKLFKPFETGEIKSVSISKLTSSHLLEFKNLLLLSEKSYTETFQLLNGKKAIRLRSDKKLSRLQKNPFRFLFKTKIARLTAENQETQAEISELEEQVSLSKVWLEIDSEDVYSDLYADVRKAFKLLQQSQKKWDITSSKATNRVAERTSASNTITRSAIQLAEKDLPIINTDQPAICFTNMNGGDIYLYPGFMIIYESKAEFAVINYADTSIKYSQSRFIETEPVPSDAKVIGKTWYKVNKDGSPDRRFSSNYQIPIALYGELHFSSISGLNEVYSFSNNESTMLFWKALEDYINAIKSGNSLIATFKS